MPALFHRLAKAAAYCVVAGGLATGRSAPRPAHRDVTVINDGIPGENSSGLRQRFGHELGQRHPNYVVIYTGMNDAANDKKLTTEQQFEANLNFMLNQALSAEVRVVLIALQPIDERRVLQRHEAITYSGRLPSRRIEDLNTVLERLSRQRGIPLVRFDHVLRAAGGPNEQLSVDGIHLYAMGYGLLAQAVRGALPLHLDAGQTVLCIGDSLTFGQGVRPPGAGLADKSGKPYLTYPQQLKELITPTTSASSGKAHR